MPSRGVVNNAVMLALLVVGVLVIAAVSLNIITAGSGEIRKQVERFSPKTMKNPAKIAHFCYKYGANIGGNLGSGSNSIINDIVLAISISEAMDSPLALGWVAKDPAARKYLDSRAFLRRISSIDTDIGPTELSNYFFDRLKTLCSFWESGSVGYGSYDPELYYSSMEGQTTTVVMDPVQISALLYRELPKLQYYIRGGDSLEDHDTIVCARCWEYKLADNVEEARLKGCADACRNVCEVYLQWIGEIDEAFSEIENNPEIILSCILDASSSSTSSYTCPLFQIFSRCNFLP